MSSPYPLPAHPVHSLPALLPLPLSPHSYLSSPPQGIHKQLPVEAPGGQSCRPPSPDIALQRSPENRCMSSSVHTPVMSSRDKDLAKNSAQLLHPLFVLFELQSNMQHFVGTFKVPGTWLNISYAVMHLNLCSNPTKQCLCHLCLIVEETKPKKPRGSPRRWQRGGIAVACWSVSEVLSQAPEGFPIPER